MEILIKSEDNDILNSIADALEQGNHMIDEYYGTNLDDCKIIVDRQPDIIIININ
jgi:DNA-binding response OmpR family regulator